MMNSVMRVVGHLLLIGIALQLGCGSPATQLDDDVNPRFRLLGRLYGQFIADNGRPPTDEAQFKSFIENSAAALKSQGVANVQELFTSPRDGEPLVVLYGKQIIQDENSGFPWIAYESKGVNGKKYIIGARGTAEEMTQEQIEALTAR